MGIVLVVCGDHGRLLRLPCFSSDSSVSSVASNHQPFENSLTDVSKPQAPPRCATVVSEYV